MTTFTRRNFLAACAGGLMATPLLGCDIGASLDPTVERGGSARLSARPRLPTLEPALGTTDLGLGVGRDGMLHVPTDYTADLEWPLFVALHGAGGAGRNWASYPARADARGMVLLAPDSRSVSWDAIRGDFAYDIDFIDEALDHVFGRCRIDPDRIALAGFSDGATYALSVGLRNGDLFSHVIAYSPGFIIEPDPAVGRPPVFDSHGRLDTILPVASSRDYIVPWLEKRGHDVEYVEFAGGHEVPAEISEQALDWFLDA